MRLLSLPFTPRYILLTLALVGTIVLTALAWRAPESNVLLNVLLVLFFGLSVLGLRDLVQHPRRGLRHKIYATLDPFFLCGYFFACSIG